MAKKEKPKATNPTIRQKKLAKEIAENGGKPIGESMRKVGYSKAYSESPDKLMKTKTWNDLMEQYLPDSLLTEKHQALLNKTDKDDQPETNAVRAGLDMAYKLKGKYSAEKIDHTIRNYRELSDEELLEIHNAKTNTSTEK